jgi:hypothetical protein
MRPTWFDAYIVENGDSRLVRRIRRPGECTAREVRAELLATGRLPSNLSVYKSDPERVAYTDCARFTHPEEC